MKHPAVATCVSALLAGLLAVAPAVAGDHADHERARAALQAGEIQPLATVLQRVGIEHPGQVLEVELERKAAAGSGRWVYEIKLLQPDGGLLKLSVDAATARVLKARSRQREAR